MSNRIFSVEIKESSRELTHKDSVRLKDTSNAIKLDEAADVESPLVVKPVGYCVLAIHNEKSEDKDYENYLIEDENGSKFVTGSPSFWTAFIDIWEEMQGSDEDWAIEIYKIPSKNYKGKYFLTCSIV